MNNKTLKPYLHLLASMLIIAVAAGCSTAKNTARSRWWQAFNARYNTYFNGSQAYIDGSLEKETGNKDNFTEMIPLYTVGNKSSVELGKSNFDRAILKAQKAIKLHSIKRRPEWNKSRRKTQRDIEWLNRREYNPFLWKAWMLMGRSQFHEGDFDAAASTFAYMSRLYETQPAIYARARAWLAKCYIEDGFLYDAEDVIRNMRHDSIPWRALKEWDYTMADYYIHTAAYDSAIPYLRKVIKHEMRRKQKAREWFLMGQICKAIGRNKEAYQAFRHTIRLNPPYELAFNARIAQTEVLAQGQSGKMIGKLKRMARSDNNKDYLDQVYYAIGNIYLAQKDTLRAIANYEQGNKKSTRNGIEKGVLLLKLGDLYWDTEKFSDAQRCYGEAIGLLDKERPDYEQLSNRSKVLDELVPYTDAIHLQDSLQELATMDEAKRNEAIDRVIAALKKKEKEEQRQKDEQAASQAQQAGQSEFGQNTSNKSSNKTKQPMPTINQQSKDWYFYNQLAVTQGKQQFQKLWGKRENADNWQRNNKTVVASAATDEAELTDEQRDSLMKAQEAEEAKEKESEKAENDPHQRAYYLKDIPFSEDAKEASNVIIMDGLYNSGVIFKDKLDNLPLSEKALRRLVDHYPTYEHMDNAYYHLFLLYSRKGETAMARQYLDSLKTRYPQSQWTTLLTDPNFVRNAREGVHLEDSLYAATYDAFKADRYQEVKANTQLSKEHFPLGANRDKFIFIGALSKLNDGDSEGCMADLDTLVTRYSTSELATMAGMIINGVKAGRKLHGGKFDIGEVWSRRTEVQSGDEANKSKAFSNERNTPFLFMLAYKPDSVNENKLLYQLARYNFTSYLVRNFDINIEDAEGLHRMQVTGFRNFDEVLQYARQLLSQPQLVRLIGKARPIIISSENLPLLGTTYSYDDYSKFYNKHFAPLKISTFYLLTEPAEVVSEPEPEAPKHTDDEEITPDEGTTIAPQGTTIETETPANTAPANQGTTIIPTETGTNQPANGTTIIPTEAGTNAPAPIGTTTIPTEAETNAPDSNGTTTIPDASGTTVTPTETDIDNFLNNTFVGDDEPTAAPTPETNSQTGSAKPVTKSTQTQPTERVTKENESQEVKMTESESKETDANENTTKDTEQDASGTTFIIDDNEQPTPPPAAEQKRAQPKKTDKKPSVDTKQKTTNKSTTEQNKTEKNKDNNEKKELQQHFDLEDEYYDLEGF